MTILNLRKEQDEAILAVLEEFKLPVTLANKTFIADMALGFGITQLCLSYGALQGMAERLPEFKLRDNDTPSQVVIPFECPSCRVQVLRQPNGRIACNCKVWK